MKSLILAAGLVLAATAIVFFYANTRRAAQSGAPAPDLWAMLPKSAPGWRATPNPGWIMPRLRPRRGRTG